MRLIVVSSFCWDWRICFQAHLFLFGDLSTFFLGALHTQPESHNMAAGFPRASDPIESEQHRTVPSNFFCSLDLSPTHCSHRSGMTQSTGGDYQGHAKQEAVKSLGMILKAGYHNELQ